MNINKISYAAVSVLVLNGIILHVHVQVQVLLYGLHHQSNHHQLELGIIKCSLHHGKY